MSTLSGHLTSRDVILKNPRKVGVWGWNWGSYFPNIQKTGRYVKTIALAVKNQNRTPKAFLEHSGIHVEYNRVFSGKLGKMMRSAKNSENEQTFFHQNVPYIKGAQSAPCYLSETQKLGANRVKG